MSITDELRTSGIYLPASNRRYFTEEELTAIADRIDAEHESACGEAYGNGVQSVALPDMTAYVKLPLDADGMPIRVGDVMDKGKVTCICDCGKGWEVIINSLYTYDAPSLRHHEQTVEDVLREMLYKAHIYDEREMELLPDLIAEYAAKLRLANSEE